MKIKDLLREPLKNFTPYKPGGKKLEVEDGIQEIERLNANENQLGPSPKAIKAMEKELLKCNFYPFTFDDLEKAREKIGRYHGFSKDHVMITGGTSGIISALGEIFLNPLDEVITCDPTYAAYSAMVQRYGAIYRYAPLKNYRFDLETLAQMINDKTKLIIIVNPNNPTGTVFTNKEIEDFLDKVPDHVITVIDEAYFDWIDDPSYHSATKYVHSNKNIIVMKTFSKLYGMAGVRAGYALMKPELCQEMKNVEFGYGASRLAVVGMMAALEDTEYVKKSIQNNTDGRNYLTKALQDVGFEVVPSYASFVYFLPKGIDSSTLIEKLALKGVFIRGYGQYARISVGLPYQNEKFVQELKNILNQ